MSFAVKVRDKRVRKSTMGGVPRDTDREPWVIAEVRLRGGCDVYRNHTGAGVGQTDRPTERFVARTFTYLNAPQAPRRAMGSSDLFYCNTTSLNCKEQR